MVCHLTIECVLTLCSFQEVWHLVSSGNLELQHFDHQISQSYTGFASNKRNPLGRRMVGGGYQVA